jgi:hypothetical protein
MLVMTSRVTMLGLSPWAGTGGSYRTIQSKAEKAASKTKATAKQCPASGAQRCLGRPQGSRNKPQDHTTLTPELMWITAMLATLLHLMITVLAVPYLVLDGHFGHHHALDCVRRIGSHLIWDLSLDELREQCE